MSMQDGQKHGCRPVVHRAVLWASAFAVVAASSAHSQEYKSLNAVVSDIQALASGSGGDATASALQDAGGTNILTQGSDTNVPVWSLRIAKAGGSGGTKILATGMHHAREWVAYRATLDMAQFILDHKNSTTWPGGDSRFNEFALFKEMNIDALTDNANIYVVPIVNPEGYYYSKEIAGDPVGYDSGQPSGWGWRKNRRNVAGDPVMPGEPAGSPLIGVDLNRNYPSSDWGTVTSNAWGETTSRWRWEEVYCGHPNGSSWTNPVIRPPQVEKETEGIVTLANNNAFDCHIDLHSCGGTVGWVQSASTSAQNLRDHGGFSDDAVLRILGAKAASLIEDPGTSTAYSPEASPYPTSGDTLVRAYEHSSSNCLPFLIEIGDTTEFRPSNPTAHADAVLPGQLFMMFAAVDKSFASKPTARFRKP